MTTLTQTHSLGEPQVAGPLAVFPVFGPPALLDYRAFIQAVELGALAKELESGAAVSRLLVANPTDLPLLIYEGEEVRQAIEQHGHADQGEVWASVAGHLADHRVASTSAAMSDVYDGRRGDLGELSGVVHHVEGQIGALACVAGVPVALDLVSRPEVFAALLGPLAQGYALDALGAREAVARTAPAVEFLNSALGAVRLERTTPGLGCAFGVRDSVLVGAGLEHRDELVQLSAFPAQSVRIARPSRRRS